MGLGRGWACIGIQLNYSKTRLLSGVGEGLGMHWDSIKLLEDWALATRIGQVGPRGAGSGRVGPSRAG